MFDQITARKIKLARSVVTAANGEGKDCILNLNLSLVCEKLTDQELMSLPKGMAINALVEDYNANTKAKKEKNTDRLAVTRPSRTLRYLLMAPSGEVVFEGVAEEQGTPRYVVAQGDSSLYFWVGVQVSPVVAAAVIAQTGKATGLKLTVAGSTQPDLFAGNGNGADQDPDEDPEPKRGRGRPRIHSEVDPDAPVEPKRPRGRPRVHPLPDPDAPVEPKRPVGRPSGSAKKAKPAAVASH